MAFVSNKKLKIIFMLEKIMNMHWCPVYFHLCKGVDNGAIHIGTGYSRKTMLIGAGMDVDLKAPADLSQEVV